MQLTKFHQTLHGLKNYSPWILYVSNLPFVPIMNEIADGHRKYCDLLYIYGMPVCTLDRAAFIVYYML